MKYKCDPSILVWLLIVCLMIFLMVIIGGVTRLTDSGLSMVEWKPLLGAIPPLNEAQWERVFTLYKQYPEYLKVNQGMSLSEFKFIFFWEYFHRLFGRLIGVVFFFPYIYFLIRKKISKSLNKKLLLAFILGGLQGLMGWYMVKSGLIDRPDVSHFRLAAHFGLALLIISYIFWIIFGQLNLSHKQRKFYPNIYRLLLTFVTILVVQIIYGAFVAGLDAGLAYNTFPKMGSTWLGEKAFTTYPIWLDIVENGTTIQFIHRTFGWIIFSLSLAVIFSARKVESSIQKYSLYMVMLMVMIQFLLGVGTLLLMVPLSLASAHQAGAVILLILSLWALYNFSPKSAKQMHRAV